MYCKLSYIPLLCTLSMQSTKKNSDLHLPFKQAVTVWFKCTSPKVILTRISWWLPLWVWLDTSQHTSLFFSLTSGQVSLRLWYAIKRTALSYSVRMLCFSLSAFSLHSATIITLSHARNVLLFYSFNDVTDQLILFSTIPPLWQRKRLILWTLNIHRKWKWLQQYYHSSDQKKRRFIWAK